MSKFKVGDRVRAVTDGGYSEDICQPGDIGTVKRVYDEVYAVHFDGRDAGPWNMFNWEIELVQPAPDLEARVAALEKLVGVNTEADPAPEYSFGDPVEVLYGGEWVEGLISAPRDDEHGARWCSFLDPGISDGGSSWWFEPHEIRPRQ